jgi:SAM-dependent methyltransferase
MLENPKRYLRRHLDLIGDVKGKKVGNLLGSCERKAAALALLGAEVTVGDISEENKRYALELAKYSGVEIEYILCDLFELDMSKYTNYFDILYLEGGILHYFDDINKLATILMSLLKEGGKLVLSDGHPFHKIVNNKNGNLKLNGDYGNYFDDKLVQANVAYKTQFPENEQQDFPDCLLRYYTLGEIVTAIAQSGLRISELIETPRKGEHKNLPLSFTLVAFKDNFQINTRL